MDVKYNKYIAEGRITDIYMKLYGNELKKLIKTQGKETTYEIVKIVSWWQNVEIKTTNKYYYTISLFKQLSPLGKSELINCDFMESTTSILDNLADIIIKRIMIEYPKDLMLKDYMIDSYYL